MKKIVLLIVCLLFLTGCGNTAKGTVEYFFEKYQNLDSDIEKSMKTVVSKENLNEENKKLYEDVLKRQYENITYRITNESYNGDDAIITVEISVYDYYKVQMEASKYLAKNDSEFNDANGEYDVQKFMNYKFNKMKETTDKINYTIDFYVSKIDYVWTVNELSNTDVEKIHGIYNYES